MKVYVLNYYCFGDVECYGAFSTREKAHEAADKSGYEAGPWVTDGITDVRYSRYWFIEDRNLDEAGFL